MSVAVGLVDGGKWSACFGLSLLALHRSPNVIRHVAGSGGIPAARNRVCRDFLDTTEAEWLLFIDTDMGFPPNTADRLIDHGMPVVGGLCFQHKRLEPGPNHGERFTIAPTIYHRQGAGFLNVGIYPPGLLRVSATGAACLVIRRAALEAIRGTYGDHWFTEAGFSEDLSFCNRLTDLGIPVHVDTTVKTTHDKGGAFLDEDAYRRQQWATSREADERRT